MGWYISPRCYATVLGKVVHKSDKQRYKFSCTLKFVFCFCEKSVEPSRLYRDQG